MFDYVLNTSLAINTQYWKTLEKLSRQLHGYWHRSSAFIIELILHLFLVFLLLTLSRQMPAGKALAFLTDL